MWWGRRGTHCLASPWSSSSLGQLPKIANRFHHGLLRFGENVSFEDNALQFARSRRKKYSFAGKGSAPPHDGVRASIEAVHRTALHGRARRALIEQHAFGIPHGECRIAFCIRLLIVRFQAERLARLPTGLA